MSKTKANSIDQVVTEKDLPFLNPSDPVKLGWKHAYLSYYEPQNKSASIAFERANAFIVKATELDFAYFVKFDDYCIFSFRGTDTEDKSIRDAVKTWYSNLDAFPLRNADSYEEAIQIARSEGILKDGPWGKGQIHDGFYTSWLPFKKWVRNVVKKFNLTSAGNIICDGHSRGGPFAELTSRDLAKNLDIANTCVTAGAPGLGTREFQREFRRLPINGIRLVDGWDLVVNAALFFEHGCAKKIWFPKSWIFKWFLPARVRDHYQKRYDKKTMKLRKG